MELMMELAVVFASLNMVVLGGLVYLYLRITWRSGAAYPVGLIVFGSLLFAQNLLTAYSYVSMTPFFGEAILPYLLAVSVFEFGALLALAKVTL